MNLDLDKLVKKKTIDTDFLKIKGNLVSWRDTIIQISNITMISTTDLTLLAFPLWSIVIIIVGIFGFELSTFFGFIAILMGIISIIIWSSKNQDLKSKKKLNFMLNSGQIFSLIFNDRYFLEKVVTVLTEVLEADIHDSNITFNIKNNTFHEDSSIINNK